MGKEVGAKQLVYAETQVDGPGARRFVNEWNELRPAHHCAVGVGHIAHEVHKLGKLLGLETARVC